MLNHGHRFPSILLRTSLHPGSAPGSEMALIAGTTNPPVGGTWNGQTLGATQAALYFCQAATSTEDVIFWTVDGGTTWTKLATLSDLLLPAVTDKTVASGVVTLTAAAHTVRGQGAAADDVDTISGMTATEIALLVTGAEAITYRDASVGAGNIATSGNASIVTATGDVVMAVLSGSVVTIVPLAIAAGLAVGADAVARGRIVRGSSTGRGEALDISAAGAIVQGDGTDAAAVTLPSSGMLAKTAATTWAGRTITGTANQVSVSNGDGVAGNPTLSAPQDIHTAATPTFAALTLGTGNLLADILTRAVIAVADTAGGGTDALLTVDLFRLDGTTVLGGARQAMIVCGSTQYAPYPTLQASVTFGTATKGSIVASAAGWCLFETDADGEFDCTVTNTDDETLYFWVRSPGAGQSDSAKGTIVVASNADSAAWSA